MRFMNNFVQNGQGCVKKIDFILYYCDLEHASFARIFNKENEMEETIGEKWLTFG